MKFIVDRPVAVFMLFLAAAVFGLVSYDQLPLDLMPDLSYPTLTVRTEYPGAAPEEVETQVSQPLEEALSTSDGLVGIQSRSRAEQSDVVLEFDWGTEMAAASQGVRERLQTTWLGDDIDRPLILHYDPSLDPILRIALSTTADSELTGDAALFQLRELAEQELKRELESLDGVAAVRVRGGLERQVLIELREDWMAARGVNLDQVRNTLVSENVNIAGGSIREGDTEYLIRTLNELSTVEEVSALEVVKPDGTRVPIGDVAEVRATFKDRKVVSQLDGREAVELEVFKEADANIVAVSQTVKTALNGNEMMGTTGLLGELPAGVAWALLDDQASFIENAINNLTSTALLGGVLAVVVLFLFLRDVRSTAIIATAIPVSVICAFAALYLGGVSLNLMSLGGLALGVGMLVDNSVVVLEAIAVHRDEGASRRDAAISGAREVSAAVTASTLTTVAVFLPIVFVEGVAGQVFGDLAMAVVCSLVASLAVALVLVPMLSALTWTFEGEATLGETRPKFTAWDEFKARDRRFWKLPWHLFRLPLRSVTQVIAIIAVSLTALVSKAGALLLGFLLPRMHALALSAAGVFGRGYDRMAARYEPVLRAALRARGMVLGGATLAFFAAIALTGTVGQELIPEVHQGRFVMEVSLPVGTPLDRTVAAVTHAQNEIRLHPDVESVYAAIGTEGRADSRPDEGEHSARILVTLREGGDIERRQREAIETLRDRIDGLERLDVQVRPSSLFTVRTPVEVVVHGQDLLSLRATADAVVRRLQGIEGISDVRSSLVAGYPEVRVRYNRALLERFNLTTGQVAGALRDKIQGAEASRLAWGERRVDMVVRLVEADRNTLDNLERINVNPSLDPPIPLSAVATLEHAEGPSEIRRVGQRRAAVVGANLSGLDLAATSDAIHDALRGLDMAPGQEWSVAGQTLEMERSLESLTFALLLAVFLVYVIMASTFESLKHPLVILFSVPLAAVGVMPALAVTGSALSVVVFIGLIVLAGMVVNNAIVLVDRINQLRAADKTLAVDEAIVAAGRARLRPILITTFTTALGLLPLAMGVGAGAEIQQPLALTIIAGLVASTLLTLLVVPVVYRVAA